MTKNYKINFLINFAFYSVCILLVYFVFKFFSVYLFPFIIGLFITIAVQKPAKILSQKFKAKKGHCALFLVILFYILSSLAITLLVFLIGKYFSDIFKGENSLVEEVNSLLNSLSTEIVSLLEKLPVDFKDKILSTTDNILAATAGFVSSYLTKTAKAAPMFFTSTVVTVIASCYIAKDFERFKESILSVLPAKYIIAISEINLLLKEKILKIILGYGKILIITFLELLIGLFLFKVPNAMIIALIISILDLLPVLGTGTILVPWSIVSFFSSKFYLGIGLIVLYVIIQIVRNAIEPKIIGKQIGLHPLIALISVFIGLKVIGVLGIFLAPLTVILVYGMFERGIFQIIFSKSE